MIDVIFAVGLAIVFPTGQTTIISKAYQTMHECRESRSIMAEEIKEMKEKTKTEIKYFAGECTAIPVKEE